MVKEVRHERAGIVWFQLYDVSGKGKSTETESRFVGIGKGPWQNGSGHQISSQCAGKVLKLLIDSDDSCTTL